MDLKQLADEIDYLKERIANLEREKLNETERFEVKVPDDIETYYTINTRGELQILSFYTRMIQEELYKRGEAFEISDNALLNNREKILLKKLEDWADWRNGDWFLNWGNFDEAKFFIIYDKRYETFKIDCYGRIKPFSKLPHFKSEELAREFIEEFGDEIKEVLL